MISYQEQSDLLKAISNSLKKDVECYAFGGNAMMFYGYKDDTKDVDLVFADEKDRGIFIAALEELHFELFDPVTVYVPEKLKDKSKPLMYRSGDIRFDLFAGKIFRTKLSDKMKEDIFALHEFRGKHTLKVKVLRKEHIFLLKAITSRDRDFEDMLTILRKDRHFDWQYFIDEVLWQHAHGDSWAILDVEEKMQKLKEYVFIDGKYFRQLYRAQGTKEGKP
jgi:hypothetical protein